MPEDPCWNYPSFPLRPLQKTAGISRLSNTKKSPVRKARPCIQAVTVLVCALDLRQDRLA